MAESWQAATGEIRQAMELLVTASTRLRAAFGDSSWNFDFDIHHKSNHYDDAERVITEVQKEVWGCLIERMSIRKLMSIRDNEKLDTQLRTGEGMPDITLQNLLAMLEGTMANIPNMIEGLVREVYDWLRPRQQSQYDYKTNQSNLWKLGHKVIKGYCVNRCYSRKWQVNYSRQKEITALDNVFHALDGKGIVKSHCGPLTDAINALPANETTGETEYFRFKCYGNNNLHIEFKRSDLLQKLNAIAGGMRLGTGSNHS